MKKFITTLFLLSLVISKTLLPFAFQSYNSKVKLILHMYFSDYVYIYSGDYLSNGNDELLFITNIWELNRLIYPIQIEIEWHYDKDLNKVD